jgi:glycosyltransferase involved in cell wall biosynthesis
MRRIRVLISTGIFPNRILINRGIYNLKAAAALAKSCDVRVVAPVPYAPSFVKRGRYAWCAGVPARDEVAGFSVAYPRYVVTPKVGRSLHGFMLYASVVRFYERVAREFSPDLILGYFAYPYGFANVLLGRRLGVPAVVFCRGSDIHSIAQNRLQGRLISWALRRARRVFSVSDALKEDVVGLGVPADHVAVIRNGIEVERHRNLDKRAARGRLGLAPDGGLVVCVSRLGREKGIDVLVAAAAEMRTAGARVMIVGDGPEMTALSGQIARLGVGERVFLAGARPHDEVPVWMAAADVTALPSRKEGHPNAAVESLACGRPVVATRVGGVPEIVTSADLGLMVPPEDPPALAAALDQSLATTWDTATIEAAGKSRSWDTVAYEMLSEFETILGGSGPTASAASGRGGPS